MSPPPDRDENSQYGRWTSAFIIAVSALIGLAIIFMVRQPEDLPLDAPEATGPMDQAPSGDDREIGRPDPLPPLEIHPVGTPLTVTIRDASARTSEGHTVDIPLARLLIEIGDEAGEPLIRVLQAIVDQPVIMAAAESGAGRAVGAAPGAATGPLTSTRFPHIVVDRLIVRGGVLGEPAGPVPGQAPGTWAYLWENVDLVIRDVVLGGGGPETFAFDLSLDGQFAGRPVRLESLSGAARRAAPGAGPGEGVEFDADVRIGASVVAARGVLRPGGAVELEVQADTLDFPGLQGLLEIIPEEGGGAGSVRITRTADRTVVDLLNAAATIAGYRLEAVGRAIATDDIIEVDAELTRVSGRGLSRLVVQGTVTPGEEPWFDLQLDAVPLLLGDSVITGRLHLLGPMESLGVRGTLALLREPGARPDTAVQPLLRSLMPAPPTHRRRPRLRSATP